LTVTPVLPLAALTTYTVTVQDVTDLAGNPLGAPVSTTFTTGAGADLARPTVTGVDPPNFATEVGTNATVTLQFSERMNPLSITPATFRVSANSLVVAGNVSVAADGLSATFTPDAPLAPSSLHFVQAFSLTDMAGNTSQFFSTRFTTGAG